MKERHWNSLVTNLRHGQSVLVLGPELAVNVAKEGPAAGKTTTVIEALTRELAAELEDDNRRVTGTTLWAVAQQYEDANGFGPNALKASAQRFYNFIFGGASDVHKALAALPFSLILTTCHDMLLTRALVDAGKKPIVQRYHLRGDKRDNPEFVFPGAPTAPLIYHLFGHAQEPASLVLSENDALDFLIGIGSERPPLPNSLVRALKRVGQSFLFVGFGIRHWYLRVLLDVVIRALELQISGSAVAVESLRGLSDSDREQTILFYQRGTRVEVEDADVGSFLADLAQRLEPEGGFVGQATQIGPRPRVFISYAREDNELAARVFDALQKSPFEPWLDRDQLRGSKIWDQRIESELDATDFALVLYTPAFCRKADSYVNREVALARRRARSVRGSFLIPLNTHYISDKDRVPELSEYQEMALRPAYFDEDFAKVVATMLRVRLQATQIGTRPRVFISYAREDNELAARVFDALQKSHFEPWLDRDQLRGSKIWDQRIESELDATDFALVLYTPAFCRKADSYVEKEVALARRRALSVRGSFLIPLRTDDISDEDRVPELSNYQEMALRPAYFDEDFARVVSTMLRDYQRRHR